MTTLYVEPDGNIRTLGDPFNLPGHTTTHRYSVIVPTSWVLRKLFVALRIGFGEKGKVAAWTRRWRCEWVGIILDDRRRILVHRNRNAILTWEHDEFHLDQHCPKADL